MDIIGLEMEENMTTAVEAQAKYIVWHKNGLKIPKSGRWGRILGDKECFIAPYMTIIPDDVVTGDIERQSAFEEMWISDLARKVIPSCTLRADQFVCYLEMFGKELAGKITYNIDNIVDDKPVIYAIIHHSWHEFLMGNPAGLLNIFLRNPYTIESLESIRDQIIQDIKVLEINRPPGISESLTDLLIEDINRIIEFKRMTILDHKLLGLWPCI